VTSEAINDIATWIVIANFIPYLGYTITYGTRSHFWESWLGWVMFLLGVNGVLLTAHVGIRRMAGDYPGYEWVSVSVYAFTAITSCALWAIITLETRERPMLMIPLKPERPPRKKVNQ
jgi:hypothetical protein